METKKHVLVVTYYFPPSGGPGVQRVLKFIRYIREFGWQPVVLTVEGADYPARDESLYKEIPADVAVFRTPIFEPYAAYRAFTGKAADTPVDVNTIPKPGQKRSLQERIAEYIRATFFIPDARIGWRKHAFDEGMRIIDDLDIRAIYSSSPPYTCAVIARDLRRATGIPWIAGFRDPWRGFLSTPERWCLPDRIDTAYERSVYEECDRLEVAWKGIAMDFQKKYPHVDTRKIRHLPNGFDSNDFPLVEVLDRARFTVTYTGSMYGKRNPETFLRAVATLVERGDVDPAAINLQFIGRFGAEVREMFAHPVLESAITVREYMPHADSVRHLFQSDALLMIVDDFTGNEEIVPGKVFEYIGSGRPVITLAPEGAVAEVIRETGAGLIARSDDVEAIAGIFLEYYRRWRLGTPATGVNLDGIRKYERREIARELAGMLDEVVR